MKNKATKNIIIYAMSFICVFSLFSSSIAAINQKQPSVSVLNSQSQSSNNIARDTKAIIINSFEAFSQPKFEFNNLGLAETPRSVKNITGQQYLVANITIGENLESGDKFIVKLESKALDFSSANIKLISSNNNFVEIAQTNYSNKIEFELEVNNAYFSPGKKAVLYIQAPKSSALTNTNNSNNILISIQNKKASSLINSEYIEVKSYRIKKQGVNAEKVEIAKGLPGMTVKDTVYIIEDLNSQEIMRFVIQNSVVLGLAKKDGNMIAGLIYDFANKAYINAITQKALIQKDEVVRVFEDLEFSFLKLPDEEKWITAQPTRVYEKSTTIAPD